MLTVSPSPLAKKGKGGVEFRSGQNMTSLESGFRMY